MYDSAEKNIETVSGIKNRGTVLKKALDIINGERQDQYGNPEDSFQIVANYWTAYLVAEGLMEDHVAISSKNTAIMMVLFKIARMSGQAFTEDSFVDAAGYIGIGADIANNEKG
jgi:hypothetical protein